MTTWPSFLGRKRAGSGRPTRVRESPLVHLIPVKQGHLALGGTRGDTLARLIGARFEPVSVVRSRHPRLLEGTEREHQVGHEAFPRVAGDATTRIRTGVPDHPRPLTTRRGPFASRRSGVRSPLAPLDEHWVFGVERVGNLA